LPPVAGASNVDKKGRGSFADVEACATAWAKGDLSRCEEQARALGLRLDAKAAVAIGKLLETVNGRRRTFLLTHADVLRAALEALDSPHGIGVRHGGGDKHTLGKTSLCLAVKPKKRAAVVIGLGLSWADRPTAGRVWSSLGPWQQDFAKNADKAQAWAAEKTSKDRVVVQLSGSTPAPTASPPSEASGEELLARVLARPDDDEPRLVYADWLSQRGDPRGELIVVQCELAGASGARKKALLARERTLLRAHGKRWKQEASQVASECELRRGFVASVGATAQAFANHGARLFERDPIEELVVSKPGPKLEALGKAPHLARLRSLQLADAYYLSKAADLKVLHAFLRSPHLKPLRQLKLIVSATDTLVDAGEGPGLDELFTGVSWPALEELRLHMVGAPRAVDSLTAAELPALKLLVVPGRSRVALTALQQAFPHAHVTGRIPKQ
jgi:uncharacterized protein (TIGR02996 family)